MTIQQYARLVARMRNAQGALLGVPRGKQRVKEHLASVDLEEEVDRATREILEAAQAVPFPGDRPPKPAA